MVFKGRRNLFLHCLEWGVPVDSCHQVAKCIIRKEVYTAQAKWSPRLLACLRTSVPEKTAARGSPLPPTKIPRGFS